jgi:hypothetical protein
MLIGMGALNSSSAGADEGEEGDGALDGLLVGLCDGSVVGRWEGLDVGCFVGAAAGALLGPWVG